MSLHIYTAPMQPATRWTDTHSGEPMVFDWPGNRLLWCGCCNRKRPAKNCVVQSFYDGLNVWCAFGKGCKDPRVIAAKKRTEFRRRSEGQRRRFALRHNAEINPRSCREQNPKE